MSKNHLSPLKFITFFLMTLITIFISHHVMVLMHEWAHGTAAWLLGYKDSPFDIYYGDWTLFSVDEDVNYSIIMAANKGIHVSIIASSALITNVILFLVGLYFLSIKTIQEKKWIYQFVFWFAIMNIAQSYSYIPIRAFEPGDVHNFLMGLGWSPWVTFIPGTIFAVWGIWKMFFRELPKFYQIMTIDNLWMKRIFLLLVVLVVFGFYGNLIGFILRPGLTFTLKFMTISSILAGIAMLIICYPKRTNDGRLK